MKPKKKRLAFGNIVTPMSQAMPKAIAAQNGAGGGLGAMLGAGESILGALTQLMEGTPQPSIQPIVNASTMRNMANPYSHMAFGGSLEDLDEEQLAELQERADKQGITVEELLGIMEAEEAGTEDEEEMIPEEEEEYEEEPEEEDGSMLSDLFTSENDDFAYGGMKMRKRKAAMGTQVEVEGNEAVQIPGAPAVKVKGPKHEKGGIDMNLPDGTRVYSDRLSIDGKTMQQRKMKRQSQLKKLANILSGNKSPNKLLKNTIERTLQTLGSEESDDMALQKVARKLYAAPVDESEGFAYGGIKGAYGLGPKKPLPWYMTLPQLVGEEDDENVLLASKGLARANRNPANALLSKDNTPIMGAATDMGADTNVINTFDNTTTLAGAPEQEDTLGNMTAGDYVGMAGNIFNTVAPILNTINNAKSTKPVRNRFKGFGQRAINANEHAQGYAETMRGNELSNLDTASNSAMLRNRNSANNVNTVRALDSVVDMGKAKGAAAINSNATRLLIGLLGQKGQLTNAQDNAEMIGQTNADTANAQNMDNYYTQMAENLVNAGTNVQGLGKNLNTRQKNADDAELIGMLSKNGIKIGRDKKGKLKIINITK